MTHNERVLEALRGGPKTHHELYGLGVIAHSRIADLRAQGHEIECDKSGDVYTYRLVGELEEGGLAADPSSSSPLPTPAVDCPPLPEESDHGTAGAGSGRTAEKRPVGSRPVQTCGSPAPPEQLTLEAA